MINFKITHLHPKPVYLANPLPLPMVAVAGADEQLDQAELDLDDKLRTLLVNLQPDGAQGQIPRLDQMEQLLQRSLLGQDSLVDTRTKVCQMRLELSEAKKLLAALSPQSGLRVKLQHKFFWSEAVNFSYLEFKLEKLLHFSTEILAYCDTLLDNQPLQPSDNACLLTELLLLVERIEHRPANPRLNEQVSQLGRALTMAVRSGCGDFEGLLTQGSQPNSLNGVIAGMSSSTIDIIGGILSSSVSIFKKMTERIDKSLILMQEMLLLKFLGIEVLSEHPAWPNLSQRIDLLLDHHLNFHHIKASFNVHTSSYALRQQMLRVNPLQPEPPQEPPPDELVSLMANSAEHQLVEQQPAEALALANRGASPLIKVLAPLLYALTSLNDLLVNFQQSGQVDKLDDCLGNILEAVRYLPESDKTLVVDYLWTMLNAEVFQRSAWKSGSIRHYYATAIGQLLKGKHPNLNLLVTSMSSIRPLLCTSYANCYNSLREQLDQARKSNVIGLFHLIRVGIESNSNLQEYEKLELYRSLFNLRLQRDHGNLRWLANVKEKNGVLRKFVIDFLRFSLGNYSTMSAITLQNRTAAQFARFEAFQGLSTIARSGFTDSVLELTHTANSLDQQYSDGRKYFLQQAQGKIGQQHNFNIIELESKLIMGDMSVLEVGEIATQLSSVLQSGINPYRRVLQVTILRENANNAELNRLEMAEISVDGEESLELARGHDLAAEQSLVQVLGGQIVEEPRVAEPEIQPEYLSLQVENVNVLLPNSIEGTPAEQQLYLFNRLQDLRSARLAGFNSAAILPNVVHLFLSQSRPEDRLQVIQKFYQLAQAAPRYNDILTLENEACSPHKFDGFFRQLLDVAAFTHGSFPRTPTLVAIMLAYGAILRDQNEEPRSEKLLIVHDLLSHLDDSTQILFKLIAPSILKIFILEMTISCVSAGLYALIALLNFPLAIILQFVVNWLRVNFNDGRTIALASRKLITTNRQRALTYLEALVVERQTTAGLTLSQAQFNSAFSAFYRDLDRRNLPSLADEEIPLLVRTSLNRAADLVIERIGAKLPEPSVGSDEVVSPLTLLSLLESELGLDLSLNKTTLLNKLILIHQVVVRYSVDGLSTQAMHNYRAFTFGLILLGLQEGKLAPLLREKRVRGYSAFVAIENQILAMTSLWRGLSASIWSSDILNATLAALLGDMSGSFLINMLPAIQTNNHPKGYQRVMSYFKQSLLAECDHLDLSRQAQQSEFWQFIRYALGIHTSAWRILRVGTTHSLAELEQKILLNAQVAV